jgi:hypothetical protein
MADETAAEHPAWLPRERRVSATTEERLAMLTLQLSVIAQRLEKIEDKQGALEVIRVDLEHVVHGFRWVRTAKIVVGWLAASLLGAVATIKFLLPSLRDLLK